jgi:hypothetical protein
MAVDRRRLSQHDGNELSLRLPIGIDAFAVLVYVCIARLLHIGRIMWTLTAQGLPGTRGQNLQGIQR